MSKTVIRFTPVSGYDLPGLERWLGRLAARGLRFSMTAGVFTLFDSHWLMTDDHIKSYIYIHHHLFHGQLQYITHIHYNCIYIPLLFQNPLLQLYFLLILQYQFQYVSFLQKIYIHYQQTLPLSYTKMVLAK